MSLVKAINEIQAEIDAFEKAIEVREGLIESLTRVNGHAGSFKKAAKAARKSGRKPLSKAARARIAEAQRQRWAKQKREAKKAK